MKRTSHAAFFILACYLFYALFPLVFSAKNAEANDSLSCASTAAAERVLPPALSIPIGRVGHAASAKCSYILLTKKRALASASTDKLIPKSSPHSSRFPSALYPQPVACISADVCLRRDIPNGFRLYHSGNSPPSA